MAMKNKKWWIWLLIVVIIALLAGAIYKSKTRKKGKEVTFELVKKRTITERISASGKVFPEKEVKISSDVSGEIVELYVQEGDSVKIGQELIRINPDTYESAVSRGRAALNDAKAQKSVFEANVQNSIAQKEQIFVQMENAKKIHDRNQKLFGDGVISEADYEATRSAYDQLQSSLRSAQASIASARKSVEGAKFRIKSAEASLQELETSLSRTSIESPIEGIVSKLSVEEGERVVGTMQMTGTEIMRVANLSSMEVQVEVSENDILRVKEGDEVEIEVDAFLDREFKGVVTEIANSASGTGIGNTVVLTSDQVTNFVVKIRIDPSSYADLLEGSSRFPFRPGMTATVDILTDRVEDVLSVPIQAVTTRERDEEDGEKDDFYEVVFLTEGDTVKMVEVTTGIQDDDYIEIKSGLVNGSQVITGPYSVVAKKLESGDYYHDKEEDKEKDD
jgi:HlyD family secretion protein